MNKAQRLPTPSGRLRLLALAASTLALTGAAAAAAQQPMPEQQSAPEQQSVPEQQSKPEQPAKPEHHSRQMQQAQSAGEVIRQWPSESQKAAKQMIRQYGEPDGVTGSALVWRDNDPWVRTIVHKEPVQHNFPMPHEDVLEQVIAHEVPAEKSSELARFHGSIAANRTAGELSVRCGQEAANFLALNLAHDIIEGERSVEDARSFYAQTIQQLMQGQEPEYTQRLTFETQTLAAAADPDEQVISEQVAASDATQTDESTTGEAATAAGAAATAAGAAAATRSGAEGESIASMLSRELRGKDVLSSDGEVVGEVTEIQSDDQGRHVARIELGGFLGLGQAEMTLPLSELTIASDGNVQTSMSKEEIQARKKQGQSGEKDRG